jgi:hypothetical protein
MTRKNTPNRKLQNRHSSLPAGGGKPRSPARSCFPAIVSASVLLLAALLAGLSLVGSREERGSVRTPPPARPEVSLAGTPGPAAEPPPGAPRERARLRHGFRPGDLLRYAFSLERAVNLKSVVLPGAADGGARAAGLTMTLSGTMTVRVYEESEEGWLAGFAFSEVEGRFQSPELDEPAQLAPGALAGETVADLARTGRIERLFLPEDMDGEGRNLIRDLLASWQVVLPEDAPEEEPIVEWSATEDDTTGRYRARYACRRGAGRLDITKTKEEYEALRAHGQADGGAESHVSGGARIVIEIHPARIEGEERIEVRSAHFIETIDSDLAYSFVLRSRDAQPFNAASVKRSLAGRVATTIAASEKGRELGMPAASAGIRDVLADVDAFLGRGTGSDGIHALMLALVAALRSDPGAVAAVMERLEDPATGDDLAAMLIGALGAAGTDPAQEGLERIVAGRTWPENRRHMAILSLVQVESPRPGLEDTLRSVAGEDGPHAGNALRLLGALGNKARGENPEHARGLQDYLAGRLADAALDESGRVAALHALHNLAPEETPAAVASAYEAADDRVRRAAIQALAGSHDTTAATLLEKAAGGDPSEAVRLAAAEVLGRGGRDGSSDLLARMLLADPSEAVRESALSALAKDSLARDSVREAIRAAAEKDPSAAIRERAVELLNDA